MTLLAETSIVTKKRASFMGICQKGMLTSIVAMMGTTAFAMLPSPEPELDSPSTPANAHLVAQNTQPISAQSATASSLRSGMSQGYQGQSAQGITTKTVAVLANRNAQGQAVLTAIDDNTSLQSGDVLIYRTYVTNNSPNRVRSMSVTTNIPKGTMLVGGVEPDRGFASVDGKVFNPIPLKGTINGQLQEIPVKYYQHLRWTLDDLGLGETAVVSYRVQVK